MTAGSFVGEEVIVSVVFATLPVTTSTHKVYHLCVLLWISVLY